MLNNFKWLASSLSHYVLLLIAYLDVNSIKTSFFSILSSTKCRFETRSSPHSKSEWMQVMRTAALTQKQVRWPSYILFRYFNNNNTFLSPTVRAWKTGRKGLCKGISRCSGFLRSHTTLEIPSTLNRPVPGSKIVGKTGEKKARNQLKSNHRANDLLIADVEAIPSTTSKNSQSNPKFYFPPHRITLNLVQK